MEDKLLKDAQYRKGLSIAWFNATNAAIELTKDMKLPEKYQKEIIKDYRNWFIDEYNEYYAQVIAKVGINYDAKETIEKLKEAKTIEDLREAWILLSQDERKDKEIIKVVQELKAKLQKKNAKE